MTCTVFKALLPPPPALRAPSDSLVVLLCVVLHEKCDWAGEVFVVWAQEGVGVPMSYARLMGGARGSLTNDHEVVSAISLMFRKAGRLFFAPLLQQQLLLAPCANNFSRRAFGAKKWSFSALERRQNPYLHSRCLEALNGRVLREGV